MKIGAIREYRPGDELVKFRDADEMECAAGSGFSCAGAIKQAHSEGMRISVALDPQTDKPFAYFGLACREGVDWGLAWMLAAETISDNAPTVAHHAGTVVASWAEQVSAVCAISDARNEAHHAWLERLGFVRAAVVPEFGIAALPFFVFEKYFHV